jgi:hypothetical protein
MADFQIDFLETYDRASIIEELRRIASVTGKDTVTKSDIDAYGRLSYGVINKRFGSLRKALEASNLAPQRYMKATENELLTILIELWERTLKAEGRRPYRTDLRKYKFPISGDTYIRRFGSWKRALLLAYNSIAENSDLESQENHAPSMSEDARKPVRESLSVRKRFFVMKRDHFACVKCGASGHGVKLEVDHIIPYSKGGTDALDNLQTLCFPCNRGKRNSIE